MAEKNTKVAEAPKKTRKTPVRLSPEARKQRDLDKALTAYANKKKIVDRLQDNADKARATLDELKLKVKAEALVSRVDAEELLARIDGESVVEEVSEPVEDEAEGLFEAETPADEA